MLTNSAIEGIHAITEDDQWSSLTALEQGQLLFFPQLKFPCNKEESALLYQISLAKKAKIISFNPLNQKIEGAWGSQSDLLQLSQLMCRFFLHAKYFLEFLIPQYADFLQLGHTIFHSARAEYDKNSRIKDISCLHIDASRSIPTQGKRILRLFYNINPTGESRVWRKGEAFIELAQRFISHIPSPFFGKSRFLQWTLQTKSYRTYYDHVMLCIQHLMQSDQDYQKTSPFVEIEFPSYTSWIVQTDQVSHADISGQYLLEQIFYLPVKAMQNPQQSPLAILEHLLQRSLV